MVEGKSAPEVEADHKARYAFASSYCQNKRVLDVACGTGYGSEILSRGEPVEVVACDESEAALAESQLADRPRNVSFCLVDALLLPFKSRAFGLCVSFETLEHLGSQEAFIRELHRVCEDNGLLILSTPN